jgi:chemotaxis protein histidine kinase CheA
MTKPLGTTDFFALEAGECLNRLEALLGTAGGPPREELVRVSRALRGSALLAQQGPIADAAGGLETLAKALRDGRRGWDAAVAEQAGQAVDRLRELVRRVAEWGEGDTARAAQLAAELASLAGGGAPPNRPRRAAGEPVELNAGVRAFVAREGALIASALDRAGRALQAEPGAREPLFAVLRRMQSLRGLAELGDLSPLPDILDGVELAIGDLTRVFAPPPGVPAVLDAAAQALSRVCRDVAERGRPVADADEARRFTELLLRAFAAEPDVVAIEALYVEGDTEPLRRADSALTPAHPAPLGPLELVSQGEHFALTADLVSGAANATERDLRLYALAAALRPLGRADGGPAVLALATLARAAGTHIASGAAAADPSGFAAVLREAGVLLRGAADPAAHERLGRALDALGARLRGEAAVPPRESTEAGGGQEAPRPEPTAAAPAPADAAATTAPLPAPARNATEGEAPVADIGSLAPSASPEAIVDIGSLAYDGESAIVDARPIVDIGSLAPDTADETAVVPIESLAPDAPTAAERADDELSPFERAFRRYRALAGSAPAAPPPLDELLRARAAARVLVPAPAVERPLVPAASPGEPAVDIVSLCYRGRGALARAVEVRHAITEQLGRGVRPDAMQQLLDELLDLVPLALDDV